MTEMMTEMTAAFLPAKMFRRGAPRALPCPQRRQTDRRKTNTSCSAYRAVRERANCASYPYPPASEAFLWWWVSLNFIYRDNSSQNSNCPTAVFVIRPRLQMRRTGACRAPIARPSGARFHFRAILSAQFPVSACLSTIGQYARNRTPRGAEYENQTYPVPSFTDCLALGRRSDLCCVSDASRWTGCEFTIQSGCERPSCKKGSLGERRR